MIYDTNDPVYHTFLSNGAEGGVGSAATAKNQAGGGSGLSRRDCWG